MPEHPNFFSLDLPADPGAALSAAAEIAINESLQVKPGERVLIVTNPDNEVAAISMALYNAAAARGAEPLMMVQAVKTQLDYADEAVIAAISSRPEIVISISKEKLGKDARAQREPYTAGGKSYDSLLHYLRDGEKVVRSFWSPRITRAQFAELVPLDYAALKEECRRLCALLDRGKEVRVTSPGGTDIVLGLQGRKTKVDDGDFSAPGSGGNLPAGEVFISPELGSSQGRIAFDGSLATHDGVLVPRRPVIAEVHGGFVTEITGGTEADTLKRSLEQAARRARDMEASGGLPAGQGEIYARNAANLGELGIGLNRKAAIAGSILVDEKVYGTCHIAIGANYDEDAPALIHLDGLIRNPTITVHTEAGEPVVLMEAGRLLI
jgi:aminopeptidase